MRLGFQGATDHTLGSRREDSLRCAFRLRGASACSDGGRRPKPGPLAARVRHCPRSTRSTLIQSMVTVQGCRSRSAGLGRPRPYGARHARRPRADHGHYFDCMKKFRVVFPETSTLSV